MTFELLNKIIEENNIPKDVKMMSDSGWECCETNMNGIYYNEKENILIFTQDGGYSDLWFNKNDWIMLYGSNIRCKHCRYLDEHGYCSKHDDKYVASHNFSKCELYGRRMR